MVMFVASVTDYKASLFALMAYTLRTDLKAAEQVARYLFYRAHVLDRHPEVSIYHLHHDLEILSKFVFSGQKEYSSYLL